MLFFFFWTINQVISDLKIHTNEMNKCLVKGINVSFYLGVSSNMSDRQRIA